MSKRNMFLLAFALIAMVGISFTYSSSAFYQNTAASLGTKLLFSIPLGEDGIHYAEKQGDDFEVWGPASLRVAPDGTFLIADTVTNRILRYRLDGSKLDPIKVDEAVSVSDVAASESSIFALDEAAPEPTIHRLSLDGSPQEKTTLPQEIRSQGLSGIAVDKDGEVMTETYGGASTARLDGQIRSSSIARGNRFAIQVPDLNDKAADHSQGFVVKGENRIPVKVNNILGGLNVIGSEPDGDFFVLVEELSNTHTLYVDQTVRHFNADGEFLGIARVPLAERYTYVAHGVAVTPDGDVIALVTRPSRADIVRLVFKRRLKPILPKADNSGPTTTPDMMTAASCSRTRDQMINMAWSYVNNRTYLTKNNLDGYCKDRIKPSYLGSTAGYYYSVPYCWGGGEQPADFNNSMSAGYVAGDLNDSRISSCPHGVDCSGFISRCWGTSRYTTSTLPNISTEIDYRLAQRGDIANRSGSHVAMIESIVSNGVMTLEATAYNSYDRVVYLYNGWSRFAGYRYYRYNNVCDTAGQARPVVSSSLRLSSGGPYYVGQTLYGYFTITNRGTQSITLSRLLIGGRLNGDQSCSGGCPDFSSVSNVTLAPGGSYSYSGSRYLDRSGTLSLFVAYQKTDGSWVTNVETEGGASNSTTITVQNQQSVPPSLSNYSPNPLYARSSNQTVYLYGQRLTNTVYMYVYFPNGGGTYIYPPGQITSRSYSTLQTYITLGGRGWYTFYAYTSDGGWSNGYSVWVN